MGSNPGPGTSWPCDLGRAELLWALVSGMAGLRGLVRSDRVNSVKHLAEGHPQGGSTLPTTNVSTVSPFRASASSPRGAVVKAEGAQGGAAATARPGVAGVVLRTGPVAQAGPMSERSGSGTAGASCRPGLVSCAPPEQSPPHRAPSPRVLVSSHPWCSLQLSGCHTDRPCSCEQALGPVCASVSSFATGGCGIALGASSLPV